MMPLKTARAFVRPLRSWSEDDQENAVRKWCEKHGVRHVEVYRASEFPREAWIRAIRETEAAVLPALHVLAELRPKVSSPSIDFGKTLAAILIRARVVVDASADCTSEQSKCWPEVVAKAQGRIQSGRALPRKEAKRRGKIGGAVTRARSVTGRWSAPEMADKLDIQASIWRDPKYSKETNRNRLHPDLRELSLTTLWRLFDAPHKKPR